MKKLFVFAIAIFAITLFAGCDEKGGDDPQGNEASIVGKWQCITESGESRFEGEVIGSWTDDVTADQVFLTFSSGSTGVTSQVGESPRSFAFSLSGTTLTVSFDGESMEYEVRKLTKKELSLYYYKSDNDGYESERTLNCVRK